MEKEKSCTFLKQIEGFLNRDYGNEVGTCLAQQSRIRYNELCEENQDEAKERHIHTRERIYPAIAIFDTLVTHGTSREEATNFVIEYYTWRSTNMSKKISKFMKLPLMYRMAPKICRTLTGKMFGETSGFASISYETDDKEVRFDMIACPYTIICSKYGCPEITKAFCNADDICFGNMHPKVIFNRTKTLADGDSCCDFQIKLTV
ncbi:MAG: L-2-amino-thiazoline-4-carboxylic acid hydrolase [Eubacteriales bacterium]